MPLPYTIALIATSLLLVVLRLAVPALPVRRYAVGVTARRSSSCWSGRLGWSCTARRCSTVPC
jgi:hypothetical protein